MKILKKNEYTYDTYSKWGDIIWFSNLEHLKDIKEDLDAIENLINLDFKNLSNKDFFTLISRFYSIYITRDDFLNALSKVNGIEYDKIEKLNSRMIFKDMVSEGHGRDFSWWEETFQIGWIVATSKDLTLNSDYNYSNEEIKQMIKNKQIISFNNYVRAIGMDPELSYEPERVEKINIPKIDFDYADPDAYKYSIYFDFSLLKEGESEFSKDVYKVICSMIKKRLNKKKILNDCKQIILFLKDNIHLVNGVIRTEAEYFIDKDVEKKYLDLYGELMAKHKILSLTLVSKTQK